MSKEVTIICPVCKTVLDVGRDQTKAHRLAVHRVIAHPGNLACCLPVAGVKA